MYAVLACHRLELGQCLERRLAQAFVTRDVMGRARGLSVLAGVGCVDGNDLALEPAFRPRLLRAHLRLEPELVGVGA